MKYYSSIISLFSLSFILIISLLYLGDISRDLEKENFILKKQISLINEQININEIEFSLHTSYDYLKKLQKIYLLDNQEDFLVKRISFYDFKNQNLDNLFTIGTK